MVRGAAALSVDEGPSVALGGEGAVQVLRGPEVAGARWRRRSGAPTGPAGVALVAIHGACAMASLSCGAAAPSVMPTPVTSSTRLASPQPGPMGLPSAMAALDRRADQRGARRGPDLDIGASSRYGRRAVAEALEPEVLAVVPQPWPAIGGPDHGSVSVGTVTTGFLAAAAELPLRGPHHAVLPKIAPRNARFGTDELRDLLLCAARGVARAQPGATLGVGNLSRATGGDSPWSVSHNNGRDADLAYYARSFDGRRLVPDHLYSFGRDLTARTGGTDRQVFDVATNWALVEALVTCEQAQGVDIEYLFMANWLKRAVLAFGRATGADDVALARAAALLHQPRNAADHADHLHVRVRCSAADRSEGCLIVGRAPASAIGQSSGVRARLPALRAALHSDDVAVRVAAAQRLGLYHDDGATDGLATALQDTAPAVRRAAATALLQLGPAQASRVAEAAGRESDFGAFSAMLHRLADADAVEPLLAALRSDREVMTPDGSVKMPVAAVAAPLLAEVGGPARAANLLASALVGRAPQVERALIAALEHLCNVATDDLLLRHGHLDIVAAWQAHAAALPADIDRPALWLSGLAARGMKVDAVGRGEIATLAAALQLPPPYADNAARALTRAVAYRPEEGRGARAAPHVFWPAFLRRRGLIDATTFARLREPDGIGGLDALAAGAPLPSAPQP